MAQKELIGQLENLIKDGNPSEDIVCQIANVLTDIYHGIQKNQWQIMSNEKLVVNKAAEFLFDSEMRNLFKTKHSGLRQYLFVLAANNLTTLNDILNEAIANPKTLKNEMNLPDNLVRKLMAECETRVELIKLAKDRSLSEALRLLSVSYTSLGQLQSAAWRTINQLIESPSQVLQSSFTYDEKRFVQELWSSQSTLRQLIFKHRLPLELADDLEQRNLAELADLSYETFQELCRDLTSHEKKTFEKIYRKESSFSATRAQKEPILKQRLRNKIAQAKEIIKTIEEQGNVNLEIGQLVSEHMEPLFLNWNGQQQLPPGNNSQNLVQISQALHLADGSLKNANKPFETDEDLIAGIDGGLAFHGLSYGLDANVICGLSPQPLFRKPQNCVIKETSAQMQKREEFFFSNEQAANFKRVINETGFSFGFNLKARGYGFKAKANLEGHSHNTREETSSDVESTRKLTMISIQTYPMATYRIDRDQLTLSISALRSLESITDVSTADTFLNQYGSHFSCGLHHLGGILCHSIELSAQQEQSSTSLKEWAKKEMEAAASLEYASLIKVGGHVKEINTSQNSSSTAHQATRITCRSEISAKGPTALQPRLFEELLRCDSRSWHVIDRDVSPQSLFPIWTLVAEKHPSFKLAADLLRKAWLRRTERVDLDVIQTERQKIEHGQLVYQNDEKEQKLVALLEQLKEINVVTIEEGQLLDKLKAFFQALFALEMISTTNINNQESPWITYVAKQVKFCQMLTKLAHQRQIDEKKFPRVFCYLSAVMDSKKLEIMEHAGYPLNVEIATMLRKGSQEDKERVAIAANASAFQEKLETVTINDLVEVLRELVAKHRAGSSTEDDLQWKMQSILSVVLRSNKLIGTANELRNAIEDLLVKDYNWRNDMFGEEIPLSIEGLAQLVDKIDHLQQHPEQWPGYVDNRGNISTDDNNTNENEDFLSADDDDMPVEDCTINISPVTNFPQQHQHADVVSTSATLPNNLPVANPEEVWKQHFAKRSCNLKKKTFSAFLTDRPFNEIQVQKEPTVYLISCLRYRISLNLPSVDYHVDKETGHFSLYDTLLRLSDEFDAAGKGEIFRLLLERRSAIPLFLPFLNGSHLGLFKDVLNSLSNSSTINLGEDTTLGRIAVVSLRKTNESQTPELLKSLFHVESLHRQDFSDECITKQPMTAEIAIGCIPIEEKVNPQQQQTSAEVRNFLILHIVGDFEPMWSFLQNFADHLIIEDSVDGIDSTYRSAILSPKNDVLDPTAAKLVSISSLSLWRQTCGQVKIIKSAADDACRCFCIDGPFGDKINGQLKKNILLSFSDTGLAKNNSKKPHRLSLCEMHSFIPEFMRAVEYSTPFNIDSIVHCKMSLADIRSKQFVLQKNYREQAIHEELKWNYRLDDERKKVENEKINKYITERKKKVEQYKTNPPSLVALLRKLLDIDDPCARVLAIRQLERAIAFRSEKELGDLRKWINLLYLKYAELSTKSRANNNPELEDTKKKLQSARVQYNESVLSIEHLWRELSHMYAAAPAEYRSVPRLAARHLIDGFPIELLDGDSNMVNLEWIQQVLIELSKMIDKPKQRIFVLSIMGVQSSGKSTLLNTMFGIQMRTSVGQCTRGVNMQLLAVQGRPQYDYILVLDTEGTRAPEYHGLEGSEKRDNQMATLSILLADATIIVNPGENDAAIKEILPIVLMAYQGSTLAEDNGGRLSNMMFFVYNRIDTTQREKLSTIIQTLATSLDDAFDAVQNLNGTVSSQLNAESPLRNFKLDASNNSSESDVRILGNVKEKFVPPNDVPDPAYGKALAEFREHIHARVTGIRGGTGWKSRSLDQFSEYLAQVWQCINTANFTLHFASLIERSNFDQLEAEYKRCEQQLAVAYQNKFSAVQKDMVTKKGETNSLKVADFEISMRQEIEVLEFQLDDEVDKIVNRKGREKWQLKYKEIWKEYKDNQNRHWKRLLNSSFQTLFFYDSQVETLKKDMRQRIRELFSSPTLKAGEWNQQKKDKEFRIMYDEILQKAKANDPPVNVRERIKKIYQESPLIKNRKIELANDIAKVQIIEKECELVIERLYKEEFEKLSPELKNEGNFLTNSWVYRRTVGRFMGSSKSNYSEPTDYQRAIFADVRISLAGKICYDDSIGYDIIKNTEKIMKDAKKNWQNIDYQKAHIYARKLITILLESMQCEWEKHNSVYAKLEQESNRVAMHQYFKAASEGVERTKLLICLMKSTLESNLAEAFENVMIQCTTSRIRNEKWLHNGKFMQNHLDLHLIELLDNDELDETLDLIHSPQKLYKQVLEKLITTKTPDVKEEHNKFVQGLKTQVQLAISMSTSVASGRAVCFIKTLRNACVNILQSQFLGQKLLIECGDEYEDCDKEDADAFRKSCTEELLRVVDAFISPVHPEAFASSLSSKVVDYMKAQNDPAALPRCDVHCPWCKSLCMEPANHNTKLKLHDTIHQPDGLGGVKDRNTKILGHVACSQYEDGVTLYRGDEKLGEFRNFETIFPGWMKPKFREHWHLREYIIANYHEDIAKRHGAKPCSGIPEEYNRDLDCIRDHLQSQIQNPEE